MLEQATLLIAAERHRPLRAEARQHALARIASCCRPTALRRAAAAWVERHRSATPCCAG